MNPFRKRTLFFPRNHLFGTLFLFAVFAFHFAAAEPVQAEVKTINVSSFSQLQNAVKAINAGDWNDYSEVKIEISSGFTLEGNLDMISVPTGMNLTISGSSTGTTLNGAGSYRGFVIDGGSSNITIENLKFNNCVVTGEAGENASIAAGGGGAGLGGAIYVKSGDLVLVDVQFTNNKAVGGDGGSFITGSGKDYGEGGKLNGETNGGDGASVNHGDGKDGTFGGGGGGSAVSELNGEGGLGAGSGGTETSGGQSGGSGGGALGAGGAVFVESGATVTVKYSSLDSEKSSTTFSGNSVSGGRAGLGAEAGDAIGNAIFTGGTVIFDTSDNNGNAKTIAVSQDIGGIGAASNLQDADQSEVRAYAGGIVVQGGGTLNLSGSNSYAGATEIQEGTLLVQGGSAIGDLSEVRLSEDGVLELAANETIGFLTSDPNKPGGEVHLYSTDAEGNKTGGRTLTVAGDGDENLFGYNPISGEKITAFTGKIMTDGNANTTEKLVKKGSGLLILGADNSNIDDEFLTELHAGTVQLDHAKGLGGGKVTVTTQDGNETYNALQIGKTLLQSGSSLTIANDFTLSGSTTNFRVGIESGYDGAAEVTLNGTLDGKGYLNVKMNNASQVLVLSNVGESMENNGVYSRAGLNSHSGTIIERGTLAVVGEYDANMQRWYTGLGSGKVVADSSNSVFRADTDGMVISNAFEINSTSLTLTNSAGVDSYTISGNISGAGGLNINLLNANDMITLSGVLQYKGETEITKGTLKLGGTSSSLHFTGGISATENGTLDLNGISLSVNDSSSSSFRGSIVDTSEGQTGEIVKTGTGTWDIQLQNTLNNLTVNAGTVAFSGNDLNNVKLNNQGVLSLKDDARLNSVQSASTYSKIVIGNKELTIAGTGENFAGALEGSGTVIVENGNVEDIDGVQQPNWILSGSSYETWTGTIDVQSGAMLGITGPGALGKYDPSLGDIASVKLNDSTLAVNVPYYLGLLGRLDLSAGGDGTVMVTGSSGLYLSEITGSGNLVKSDAGVLILDGSNEHFTGNVIFEDGTISVYEGATFGSGNLISAGDGEYLNTLEIYTDENESARVLSNGIVLNEDLLISNLSDPSLILQGEISGDATLYLSTLGKTILRGDYDDFEGYMIITGGTVQLGHVAGSGATDMKNALVGVYSGATFNASGSVGAISVARGGNLVLSGSGATLNLGALELLDGSNVFIDCDGINSGKINVSGTETSYIAGGTVHVNVTGDVNLGDSFTFMEIDPSAEVKWQNQLSFSDNVDGMRIVGVYDNDTGEYQYKFVFFDYLNGVTSKNAQRVGDYLNYVLDYSSVPTAMNPALNRLEEVLGENPTLANYAYAELSGEVYASTGIAQLQALSTVNQALASQLRPGASIQSWDGTGVGSDEYLGQIYADRGLSGWMSGYGLFGKVDPDGNASGYDLDVYGGMIGIERCSNNLSRRLGFYYAYGDTSVDTNTTLGKGTSDDHRLGLYMKWDDRFGYGIMSGNVGFNSFKFNRRISVITDDTIRSSIDGTQASFYAERGMTLNLSHFAIQPFVAVQYAYQSQDSFRESGMSGFNLLGDSMDTNSLRTMLGSRFVKECYGNSGMLQMHLQAYWMHEYLDDVAEFNGRFSGIPSGSSFQVTGNGIGTDWAVAGLGAQWSPTRHGRLNLFGSYDAQFNSDTTLHAGNFGVKVVW